MADACADEGSEMMLGRDARRPLAFAAAAPASADADWSGKEGAFGEAGFSSPEEQRSSASTQSSRSTARASQQERGVECGTRWLHAVQCWCCTLIGGFEHKLAFCVVLGAGDGELGGVKGAVQHLMHAVLHAPRCSDSANVRWAAPPY